MRYLRLLPAFLFLTLVFFCPPARAGVYVHPGSRLVFPQSMAGLARSKVTRFKKAGLGVGIAYRKGRQKAYADVFLYDRGLNRIEADCGSGRIRKEFETSLKAIVNYARKKGFVDFREMGFGKIFLGQKGGGHCAWESGFEYRLPGQPEVLWRSFFVLTAKRNLFVKLRYTTPAQGWDRHPANYRRFLVELGKILEQ